MVAQRVNHIQRFFIRSDDLRLAERNPDVSRMDIDVGTPSWAKIFGVALGVGRFDSHMHAHAIRRRGGSISPGRREWSSKYKIIQIRLRCEQGLLSDMPIDGPGELAIGIRTGL